MRGLIGELIFKEDRDRETVMQTLGETSERAGFVIYNDVLMSNYHLLLKMPVGNLGGNAVRRP
jgi:hypothetical protein